MKEHEAGPWRCELEANILYRCLRSMLKTRETTYIVDSPRRVSVGSIYTCLNRDDQHS